MDTQVEAIQGDITTLEVDAIVNPANTTLLGGGGLDGQIHRKAGPDLLIECKKLGGCKTGEAKITKGFNLPAKFIIHTVGPIYGYENGQEAKLLSNCYLNSLELAKANGLKSIAFPAISTGAFRYPKDEAAKIALNAIQGFVNNNPSAFDKIIFTLYTELDYNLYKDLLFNK